jgi:YegS/Rv2252/BmrU family lipid kinase
MLALLTLNERSRRGRELAPKIRAALSARGINYVEVSTLDDPSRTVDCLIVAGGDGTIVDSIETAMAHDVPVGIIPLGTFNDLARTLEIPFDIEAAVDVIAAGAQRRIDVGCVNGHYFVNEASIGISSRLTRLQTPELKQRFGFLGVIATAFQAFWFSRPISVDVRYNDTQARFRTVQLTIANSNRFGGVFDVKGAAIDDGWLDLYAVEVGPAELLTFRSTRFYVRTRHAHRIAADGEPAGRTPAVFEVLPKALRVYVRQ